MTARDVIGIGAAMFMALLSIGYLVVMLRAMFRRRWSGWAIAVNMLFGPLLLLLITIEQLAQAHTAATKGFAAVFLAIALIGLVLFPVTHRWTTTRRPKTTVRMLYVVIADALLCVAIVLNVAYLLA